MNGELRTLKSGEISVVSRIHSHCKDKKDKQVSVRRLADELNISAKTVQRALDALVEAKLIYRTKVGVNGRQGSVFTLNRKVYEIYNQCKKKAKKQAPSTLSKELQALEARAERERYYTRLRERARDRADENLKKARQNADFKNSEQELNRLKVAEAKAEVFNPSGLEAVREAQKKYREIRTRALEKLCLTEEMIVPQYHCKKCSDTGFLPSGVACNCYNT